MCVRGDVKEESDVDSEAGGIFSTEEDDLDYELDRTSESKFELMRVFTLANIPAENGTRHNRNAM